MAIRQVEYIFAYLNYNFHNFSSKRIMDFSLYAKAHKLWCSFLKTSLLRVCLPRNYFRDSFSKMISLSWRETSRGQRYLRWVCRTLDWSRSRALHVYPRRWNMFVLSYEKSAERRTIRLNSYYGCNLIISVLLIVLWNSAIIQISSIISS